MQNLGGWFLVVGIFGFGAGSALIIAIGQYLDAPVLQDLASEVFFTYLFPISTAAGVLLHLASRLVRKAAVRSIVSTGERAEATILKVFIDHLGNFERMNLWLEVCPTDQPHFQAETELTTPDAFDREKFQSGGKTVVVMYDPHSKEVALIQPVVSK